MEFDMASLEYTIHEVGNKNYRYGRPFFDGAHFWLPPLFNTKTMTIKWNPGTKAKKEIPEIQADKDNWFLSFVSCGEYLWLLPITGEHAYKINTKIDSVTIADEFESGYTKSEVGKPYYKYFLTQTSGDSIYAFFTHTSALVEYDCTKGNRKEEAIAFSPEAAEQLSIFTKNIFQQNRGKMKTTSGYYYYESFYTRANAFFEHLVEKNNDEKTALHKRRKELACTLTKNADGTAGEEILKMIKKII